MVTAFRNRTACALCESPSLGAALSLAATPPANEFVPAREAGKPQDRFPLDVLLCGKCGHLQLGCVVDPERLFRDYVYVSGTSPVFVDHFRGYAEGTIRRFRLGASSFVFEIGSNDGTLLKQYQQLGITNVLGIDPATKIAAAASEAGVPTLEGFFSPASARTIVQEKGRADLIVANNVFAHAEDLRSIAEGVRELLQPHGAFVFEVSYLRDVVDKLLFDTIYHEHLSFHAVRPLTDFFARLGMRLFDVERIGTHGGSIRCYVGRDDSPHQISSAVGAAIADEERAGLFSPDTYRTFKQRIGARAAQLRQRLDAIPDRRQTVAGFGAPAKLTTLMYEFGIGADDVGFIIDDSPWKQGLFTPGKHIPVVSADALATKAPAYCIVFAWNFAEPIIRKHADYRARGGRFIVPLPDFQEL